MKKLEELTQEDIDQMSYNELISITLETNRPPGGIKTLKTVLKEAFIMPHHKILEVGTSTGFTAIELARLSGANITGIDINERSIKEAISRAMKLGVQSYTRFEVNNAMDLSYQDSSFDVVFCGNVTSYIPDRRKALEEYCRVLKDGGFLVAIPMFYLRTPPESLISKVSEAIKFTIKPEYKEYWMNFFKSDPFILHFSEDYKFDKITDARIEEFTNEILSMPHLAAMKKETLQKLAQKYSSQIQLFAENLSYMGYTMMVMRKEKFRFDSELFTGSRLLEGENYDQTGKT